MFLRLLELEQKREKVFMWLYDTVYSEARLDAKHLAACRALSRDAEASG